MVAVPGMTLHIKKCRYVNAVTIDQSWFALLLEKGWSSRELCIGDIYLEDEKGDNFVLTQAQFNNLFETVEVN